MEKQKKVGNIMTTLRSRKGVTIIELMVVFAIMGFLATVAVPKFFGVAEKTREKADLMKLYYLRDALNRALIEDMDAFSKYTPTQKNANTSDLATSLSTGLNSNKGATLFVIELHNELTLNVQGSHGKANEKIGNQSINICPMIGSGGTWFEALKEARFDGVADIIKDRLAGNKFDFNSSTYSATPYVNQNNKIDYRTAPKNPMFLSKALNHGKSNENTRYTMSVQWSPGNEGFSVEVFLLPNGKDWNQAYRSDNGICFSTYGRKGCAKSN